MKRRDFIKLGVGTYALGNVTASIADDKSKDDPAVLFLFLNGGASHIETFNPIPLAPADRRSTTGSIKTNVTGVEKQAIEDFYTQRSGEFETFTFDLAHINSSGTVRARFEGPLEIDQVISGGSALTDNFFTVKVKIKEDFG